MRAELRDLQSAIADTAARHEVEVAEFRRLLEDQHVALTETRAALEQSQAAQAQTQMTLEQDQVALRDTVSRGLHQVSETDMP